MSWEQYRSVMERYAIKTDDMATEDAYFIATHMPFSQLDVYLGGKTESAPKHMTEEEIFDNLVYNPRNAHRLIIVRGDNGTGKSHLIRYLKARLENSASTVYDPAKEQLIFLRRLNNSVRGVFSQLLEQQVIRDPEVEEKLRRFVRSSDSRDEASFKTEILFAYVAAVSNDLSGSVYKPVICRDIASYLSDSRVREHLLREDGAVARCYNIITAPSNQVLKDTKVFSPTDFLDERGKSSIIKAVKRQGDPQASDFAATLLEDDSEIDRLVNYLNRFTREVIQRCADISSESTKSVFEQLRRELKRQGRNLTLFIEDFTGFTGIDTELITVLSTEHGGDYSDLCRVTAIIGITNDYFDQFRDNFKDRVTHQISVTDRSYGTNEFLIQMAGRYLNAIYCDPAALRDWERNGAALEDLPISTFRPPCAWETVKIAGRDVTLYPFNSQALTALYEGLIVKSPRAFLKEVLRAQLKEYFDGKIYGDGWDFPLNPKHVQMHKGEHASAIDRLEGLSSKDRSRLKSVFALWADGTAAGVKEADGAITFGGLNKAFLDDIGLSQFNGIGAIVDQTTGESAAPQSVPAPDSDSVSEAVRPAEARKSVSRAEQDYIRFQKDIDAWYSSGAPLQYHADYRKMLQSFICGDNKQCGAVNWQDIGVPAYVAAERLSDISCFSIEGQDNAPDPEKVLVHMERSAESRDALQALIKLRYFKGWDFDGSAYYQQRLLTWLERNKAAIIEKVTAANDQQQLSVIKWCLALQYLRAMIFGRRADTGSPAEAVKSLFVPFRKDDQIRRETKEWNDLVQFVLSRNPEFDSALAMLQKSSAATMGAIQLSRDTSDRRFYRGDELIEAAEQLIACGWDIESELPADIPDKHLLYNPASLLKKLYPKIRSVMAAERKHADAAAARLTEWIGELNQENLIRTLASVQELFRTFNANGILGSSALRIRFEKPPVEMARDVMKWVTVLTCNAEDMPVQQLSAYSGNALNSLCDFLRDIQTIAQLAEQEEARAKKELAKISTFTGMEAISEAARACMEALYDQLEGMEVYDDAAD
ncbi:MAG: hypothetical protein IJ496_02510 [Ruminococcus sp.]|nr:hypothetical protein [Ruminococcus sp.]